MAYRRNGLRQVFVKYIIYMILSRFARRIVRNVGDVGVNEVSG